MRVDQPTTVLCALSFLLVLVCLKVTEAPALPLEKIKLPDGFQIGVFSDKVPGARQLSLGSKGTVFVGSRAPGMVYALRDTDQDGVSEERFILAKGLNSPNGVAFRDGSLFVGEVHRIVRLDKIEENLSTPPAPVVVNDSFPRDTHHGYKFIRFGPDKMLYFGIGAPCNVCLKYDQRFASLLRMNPNGSGVEVFARGVRNTVGFDWDPNTGELWFTDNGRDWLGDNSPPDELNHAPRMGMHFGFPFCHGSGMADPDFGKNKDCGEYTPVARELGPHVASLGMRFYTGEKFPKRYRNMIFIAEHGSWNRTTPIGYRVTSVGKKPDGKLSYEVFAQGWLKKNFRPWGRPVDVLNMPDGSMLVSDDFAGAVYRISYEPASGRDSGKS